MDGHPLELLRGVGSGVVALAGSFAPNGSSDPVSGSSRGRDYGLTFTVAYSATGVFTVTLPEGFTLPAQPMAIICSAQVDALASYFEVMVVGDTTLNTATRQFVLQAHRSGTGREVAAATGSRINFLILARNTTGK